MSECSFRNRTNWFAGIQRITFFYRWSECPFLLLIKRRKIHTALKEVSRFLREKRKRVLQTVVCLTKQSRSKLYTQKITGKLNSTISRDSLCHFIDLHLSGVASDADYFTFKAFAFDLYVAYFVE